MPNCDFYALGTDLRTVIEFVFAQPGWQLVELCSEPDHDLREFRTLAELVATYPALAEQRTGLHFQLYSESMGGSVRKHRVDFKPGVMGGATFRYDSMGWGLIQLYFGILRNGRLSPCHTNHNSERRAQTWALTEADELGPVAAWNWTEVTRISSRLNRFIRGNAKGKVGSRPIMPSALQASLSGTVEFALN